MPKCKRLELPMNYTGNLSVHAHHSNLTFLDSIWESGVSLVLDSEKKNWTISWTLWQQILVLHAAFIEIAYEMPEETPYSDGIGEIEDFIDRFRVIVSKATDGESPRNKSERAWLMSVLAQTEYRMAGVSMSARLVLLVQGIADRIATEPKNAQHARVLIKQYPYSYVCSGKIKEFYGKGWL